MNIVILVRLSSWRTDFPNDSGKWHFVIYLPMNSVTDSMEE